MKVRIFFQEANFYPENIQPRKTLVITNRHFLMKIPTHALFSRLFLPAVCFISTTLPAQMITGVWKGKINRQKVEIKIIQNGDSLTGTSYYYESAVNYRRYSIKRYY